MKKWQCATYTSCDNFAALPLRFKQLNQLVKLTVGVGGSQLRLRLANRYGRADLTFDQVRVAVSPVMIDPLAVTVDGQATITIPAGEEIITDAVTLAVQPGQQLYVALIAARPQVYADFASTYDPRENNACLSQAVWLRPQLPSGDHARKGWVCLAGIDVLTDQQPLVVEVTGDSLGEMGLVASSLLGRLRATGRRPVVLINTAVSGSRLLHDAPEDQALYATFGRSLLHRQATSWHHPAITVALVGSNDLILPFWSTEAFLPTVDQFLHGVDQLACLVTQRGSQLLMTTIPPFDLHLPAKQRAMAAHLAAVRRQINARLVKRPDVVNVDPLVVAGDHLTAQADFGDQLHYSAAGANLVAGALCDWIDAKMSLSQLSN